MTTIKVADTITEADLSRAAMIAVEECLGLQAGQALLIISNPDTEQEIIARAVEKAAKIRGCSVSLLLQPVKSQADFAEDYVLEAIEKVPDAVVSLSADKLGKDAKRLSRPLKTSDGRSYDHIFTYLLSGTRKIRSFWSPGVSIECFSRTLSADYNLMRRRAGQLKQLLDQSCALRVFSSAGTDLRFGTKGRRAHLDDGDFKAPGKGGNLPAGEVFISPSLGSAQGTVVFEDSMADIEGCMLLKNPITCNLSGGYIMDCEGGEQARQLEAALRKGMDMASSLVSQSGLKPEEALRYATNARNLGEFGIGLNEKAKITGNMLEDEKIAGTCHFAIGFNYEEDAPAMIHLDGLVQRPTIIAIDRAGTERCIMENGKALFDDLI
ncbi:MAG: aminopeptidase [Spirochaetia bacterium]|jgi:leucyl aminopeptidase (aminopeptidase T)|nr:aminopeptidase [Spirochaetia bacterium]